MREFKLFINNMWVDAENGATFESVNPCNGESVAMFASASANDVNKAIAAAQASFDKGVWSELDPEERCDYMMKAASIMKKRSKELATLETLDTGKPFSESYEVDMPYAVRAMEYHARAACNLMGETINIPGHFAFDFVTYEPYGVVGSISPWNFPLHLFTRSVCPAIAVGNTVVAKASSLTPSTSQLMGEIFIEAGFPAGVVNIVSGPGSVVGEAIMAHPDVRLVSFTGSEEVGRTLLTQSAKAPTIKKLILELGGKGPIICEADCDVEGAVNSVLQGFCLNQGEVCCASTRLYLHEAIYDRFVEMLKDRANRLKVGDSMDSTTQMGALISKNQFEIVDRYVKEAIAGGAKLVCGGKRLTGGIYDKGYYYPPTILEPSDNKMACVQEEIFGPVLVVLKYSSIDDAIRMANESTFGLGAAVWSDNPRTLYHTARKLDSGTVWMNTNIMSKIEAPYGGNKNSGIGRENGLIGLKEYLRVKNNIFYVGDTYGDPYGFNK